MLSDDSTETGWTVIAENEEMATLIDAALELDADERLGRSELADRAGISLKTLHLMDDLDRIVDLGVLDKHDSDSDEATYSVNEDSDILEKAREFGEAVEAAQPE